MRKKSSPRAGSPLSLRQLRVGEEVKRLLADFVRKEGFYQPELENKTITFTEVRVSPDLRHAWVFTQGCDGKDASAALTRTAPYLRKVLAKQMALRTVPELHFMTDHSLDEGQHIEELLKSSAVKRDLDPKDED